MDKGYAIELEASVIPTLEKQIEQLEEKIETKEIDISRMRTFSLPFSYHDDYIGSYTIFSSDVNMSWKEYKDTLYSEWVGKKSNHRLISSGLDKVLYYMFMTAVIALTVWLLVVQGFGEQIIDKVRIALIIYAIAEVIAGLVSVWYFVVRINGINKSEIRKEIKRYKKELKIKSNDLEVKKGLLEQYKIASLNPNQELARIKGNTAESLKDIVKYTRDDVIPNIKSDRIKTKYLSILDKCDEILKLAETNGAIITEVSKIYNIYISDINNIITKGEHVEGIYELLDNFSTYLDRKINKFRGLNELSIASEISALNDALKEEQ